MAEGGLRRSGRMRRPAMKTLENLCLEASSDGEISTPRRYSTRRRSRNCFKSSTDSENEGSTLNRSPRKKSRCQLYNIGSESDDQNVLIEKFANHQLTEKHAEEISMEFNTPRKNKISEASNAMRTPRSARSLMNSNAKTPSHMRQKLKKDLKKYQTHHLESSESDWSSEHDDFVPSEEEEDESDTSDHSTKEVDDENKKLKRTCVKTFPISNRTSVNRKKLNEYVLESEKYFNHYTSKKIVTSDHTLSRLKQPRLETNRVFSLLSSMELSHKDAILNLLNEYESQFPRWMHFLDLQYNLILYGVGSKRCILENFRKKMLSNEIVLEVNGFFPSLTVKDILDNITHEIFEMTSVPANLNEIINIIESKLKVEHPEIHIFLIIHNIDGVMLRNEKSQEVLSRLAKIENIHLIASIDHINACLLWNHKKLKNFNFIWWDATTMVPYVDEIKFENSLLIQDSGQLVISSIKSVFQSLTTNARGIFMLIAETQLKEKENSKLASNYQGLPFKNLYWMCRNNFLVSTDTALRAQLTEFIDHKLVKIKRATDGIEYVYIPIDNSFLQQFISEQQK